MRRKIIMQPPGNITGHFKATRVGSSTCPKPGTTTDGTVIGVGDVEIDYSDHTRSLTGEETFLINHALETGDLQGGCYYH